jgi:Transposase and inactivated derivatives, IS30 family
MIDGGGYMRTFKHLTWDDRIVIESYLRIGMKQREIARIIGVHESTVSREIRRGKYLHRNSSTWLDEERYSPDIAFGKYLVNIKNKGPNLKIGSNLRLAKYIEQKIIKDKYSPETVMEELKRGNNKFGMTLSKATIYSYIDKGVFLKLSNEHLQLRQKKRNYEKIERQRANACRGISIEKRPLIVSEREDFGHWEMDTVMGKQGRSKCSLLVFTERKTRCEIIVKLPNHTATEVVKALNRLERHWGKNFKKIFKTITVDNGTEFSFYEKMKKSILYKGFRTEIYYCHAYSSWERGSNENANRLIRRHIPKGTNFDKISAREIKKIEKWMNDYPRRMFNYQTAAELFTKEIEKIIS